MSALILILQDKISRVFFTEFFYTVEFTLFLLTKILFIIERKYVRQLWKNKGPYTRWDMRRCMRQFLRSMMHIAIYVAQYRWIYSNAETLRHGNNDDYDDNVWHQRRRVWNITSFRRQ